MKSKVNNRFYIVLALFFTLSACAKIEDDSIAHPNKGGKHSILINNEDVVLKDDEKEVVVYPFENDSCPVDAGFTIGQAVHGTADILNTTYKSIKDLNIVYVSEPEYSGKDSIVYQVCSGNDCKDGIIRILVRPNLQHCRDFKPDTMYVYGKPTQHIEKSSEKVFPWSVCTEFLPASFEVTREPVVGKIANEGGNSGKINYITGEPQNDIGEFYLDSLDFKVCNEKNLCIEKTLPIKVYY